MTTALTKPFHGSNPCNNPKASRALRRKAKNMPLIASVPLSSSVATEVANGVSFVSSDQIRLGIERVGLLLK